MLTVADTAFAIAAIRAAEAELPPAERLFEDPYARCFAEAGAHAAEGLARFLSLPFFRDGIRLRTRALDDFVREGIAAGASQFVLLGAGLDTRGIRLASSDAGVTFYEIDAPALLATKRACLDAAGVGACPRVVPVPCDFEEPGFEDALPATLAARGFRVGAGAHFLWEGVIGYISDAAMDRSLAFMARAGGAGSRLALTYGEGTFYPETPQERLRRSGFARCEDIGFDALWRRYLPGEPHESAWAARVGLADV